MRSWAELLRGVDVGGCSIKMAELRGALEELGLTNVVTVLQSGNVTFDSPLAGAKLQDAIEEEVRKRFGYDAHAQVIEREQLQKVVDSYPFGTAGEQSHDYVGFMERGLEKDLAAENVELGAGEKVEAGDGVVYWRVDKGS